MRGGQEQQNKTRLKGEAKWSLPAHYLMARELQINDLVDIWVISLGTEAGKFTISPSCCVWKEWGGGSPQVLMIYTACPLHA